MSLLRGDGGSSDSIEITSRSSSDSACSGGNSTHNSTSSIPSSLSTTATNHTHNGTSSPPLPQPSSPASFQRGSKPKKFSLNLNGHLTPSPSPLSPGLEPADKKEEYIERGVHQGNMYINKEGLVHDLKALSTMPELCDVTFLVGEDRQPVCGVKAILAARSRIFRKMLYIDTTSVIGSSKRNRKRLVHKPSDGYIEKYDIRGIPTVIIRDFEPEVFKQLINYTHTGTVILQARTLLGLMNASDHYCLEELKQACIRFMEHCITVDSVCSLLCSAEKYIQYKSTKIVVQKIFEFVDNNAESILTLRAFLTLPQHVVRIVLGREELKASEITKFDTAYNWCLNNSDLDDNMDDESELKKKFEPFVDVINYNLIPAKMLMQRVKPAGVVDDSYILTALAYQADPSSVPVLPVRSGRRSISIETSPQKQIPSRFRRVHSSGMTMDSTFSSQRVSNQTTGVGREVRAGSVPLSSRLEEEVEESETDNDELTQGSEIYPLRVHDVKERMDSQSSSHLSALSTPPLSPVESPSVISFRGSMLSASSFDSVPPVDSPGGNSPSSIPGQSSIPKKKIAYNPNVLDAIVNLNTSNVVEV